MNSANSVDGIGVGSLGLRSPCHRRTRFRIAVAVGTCLSREAVLDVLLTARLVLALSLVFLLYLQSAFVSRVLVAELLTLTELAAGKFDATPPQYDSR
jgi:hypothetical protein